MLEMITRRAIAISSVLCCCGLAAVADAQSIRAQQIGGGSFNSPLGAAAAPGDTGRLFVVEQPGTVRIVNLVTNTTVAAPFINLGTTGLNLTAASGERGLLGFAFDPAYATNGRFYVNYTDRVTGATVIRRYTANTPFATSGTANTASGVTLLTFAQPFDNHNGGQLAFGPDGKLYCGSGDGGSGDDPNENAQNLTTPLGKILRFDVNNAAGNFVPADNPFAAGQGGASPYIWAFGMRNPWRLSFDRQTGDLWIADVGQDNREEIDFQPALTAANLATVRNRNYGWDCREGLIATPTGTGDLGCNPNAAGFTNPVFDAPHSNGVCSISGGYVYRGAAIPELQGAYLFSDFCASWVRSFRYAGTGNNLSDARDFTSQLTTTGAVLNGVVSFAEDAAGELYVVSIGGGANSGALYKILPNPNGPSCGCPCTTAGMPVLFSDNFNTNLGWTVATSGTDGGFVRAAPINGGVWTNDPIGDSDGSGQCFVTANRDDNSDVDGGPTSITSPAFDWSGKQISLCYDYFLNLTVVGGSPADSISVEVSSNGLAGPWRQVAVHATNGGFVWRGNVVTQSQLTAAGVTNTTSMRVRFVAADVATASIVEAGIDAFKVFDASPPPTCAADFNGDGDLNPDDLADYIGAFFAIPPTGAADFNGDGTVDPDDLADYIGAFFAGCP